MSDETKVLHEFDVSGDMVRMVREPIFGSLVVNYSNDYPVDRQHRMAMEA